MIIFEYIRRKNMFFCEPHKTKTDIYTITTFSCNRSINEMKQIINIWRDADVHKLLMEQDRTIYDNFQFTKR